MCTSRYLQKGDEMFCLDSVMVSLVPTCTKLHNFLPKDDEFFRNLFFEFPQDFYPK